MGLIKDKSYHSLTDALKYLYKNCLVKGWKQMCKKQTVSCTLQYSFNKQQKGKYFTHCLTSV